MQFSQSYLDRHSIHIMCITETNWSGELAVDSNFPNHHWFGRTKPRHLPRHGGVGFLIHYSLLVNNSITVINGTDENSIFIHIHSQHKRDTLLALVYGRASGTTVEYSAQCEQYADDLDSIRMRFHRPYDIIFMGDINARLYTPMNPE